MTNPYIEQRLHKMAVEVKDKSSLLKSPLSYTVGRLGNIPQGIILGTSRGIFSTANTDRLSELIQTYEDRHESHLDDADSKTDKRSKAEKTYRYVTGVDPEKKEGELTVSVGGTPLLHNLKKVWTRPGISLPGRLLGTILSPASDITASLQRSDNYNPFAHTSTMFTDEPAVSAHELGHAADYQEKSTPVLYALSRSIPFAALYQEGEATTRGMGLLKGSRSKHLKKYKEDLKKKGSSEDSPTEKEKIRKKKLEKEKQLYSNERAQRLLSGGMGSYAGSMVGGMPGALAGGLTGQAIGAVSTPWRERGYKDSDQLVAKSLLTASLLGGSTMMWLNREKIAEQIRNKMYRLEMMFS